MKESLYGYSSFAEVEVRDWILVISSTDRKELKIRFLQNAMSKSLSKIEDISIQASPGRTRGNLCVYYFPIAKSYCCVIPEGEEMSGTRDVASIWRPFNRCMSTMAHYQAIRCGEARTVLDTLVKQKCCYELTKADRSCCDEDDHVPTSLGEMNTNDHHKNLFLPQNVSYLEESQLPPISVLGAVCNIFGF